jgi:hypothetical protein
MQKKFFVFPQEFVLENLAARKPELLDMFSRIAQANVGAVFVVDEVGPFCCTLADQNVTIPQTLSILSRKDHSRKTSEPAVSVRHKLTVPVLKEVVKMAGKPGNVILVSSYLQHHHMAKSFGLRLVLFFPDHQNTMAGDQYRVINDLSLLT